MITIKDNSGHIIALMTIEEYIKAEEKELSELMARANQDPCK